MAFSPNTGRYLDTSRTTKGNIKIQEMTTQNSQESSYYPLLKSFDTVGSQTNLLLNNK